jgi:hypothetical protein
MLRLHTLCAGLLVVSAAAAGDHAPEIQRPPASPQAVGVAHTLRTIPEACARLEGRFTGDAAEPYALVAVRTGTRCQPRAALRRQAPAGDAEGWLLNDLIRVPSAACPSRQAVVRVWRKPVGGAAPTMDAQGKARVYLKDGLDAAANGKLGAIPQYAVAMAMEGRDCR